MNNPSPNSVSVIMQPCHKFSAWLCSLASQGRPGGPAELCPGQRPHPPVQPPLRQSSVRSGMSAARAVPPRHAAPDGAWEGSSGAALLFFCRLAVLCARSQRQSGPDAGSGPQSKTVRDHQGRREVRQVLDCASPSAFAARQSAASARRRLAPRRRRRAGSLTDFLQQFPGIPSVWNGRRTPPKETESECVVSSPLDHAPVGLGRTGRNRLAPGRCACRRQSPDRGASSRGLPDSESSSELATKTNTKHIV